MQRQGQGQCAWNALLMWGLVSVQHGSTQTVLLLILTAFFVLWWSSSLVWSRTHHGRPCSQVLMAPKSRSRSKVPHFPKWHLLYVLTYQRFPCRLKEQKWMNVQVGDIIKLENNNFVTVSTISLYPDHSQSLPLSSLTRKSVIVMIWQ